MAQAGVPSGSSICWQYEWNVTFAPSTLTVTEFIGIPSLELTQAFRLGMGINSQCMMIRLSCYVNSVDLARLGFRVQAVSCCLQEKHSDGQLKLMELRQVSNNGTHLLFSWERPSGSFVECNELEPCLTFQLHLTGTVDQYAAERFDTNLGMELCNAVNNKLKSDICVRAGRDESLSVSFDPHKFVLAARSPVFRAMFEADMVESRTGRVEIPDVDPQTFVQFLHFLYTGKLLKPASKELGNVAEKYQVETLISLCREADAMEGTVREGLLALADKMRNRYDYKEKVLVPQDAEVEILSVESFVVENAAQQLNRGSQSILEDTFLYRLNSTLPSVGHPSGSHQVTFYCNRTNGIAWKITSVHLVIMTEDGMERFKFALSPRIPSESTDKQPLQVFTASIHIPFFNPNASFRFVVHRASTVGTFQYQLRDSLFAQQLWSSAVNNELTDVEFQVGDKIFPAHSAILLTRSAAMQLQGQPSPSAPLKHHVTTVDADAWEELLHFLYTGLIRKSQLDESLSMAAKTYRISTLYLLGLRKVGLDQEQLSDAIMSLF